MLWHLNVWFYICRVLIFIKFPPRLIVLCAYAKSVTNIMLVTSTPKPCYKLAHLNSHPFVDYITRVCNEWI